EAGGGGWGGGAEVGPASIAMIGRIEVGPGVADQRELVDGESGAGGVVLTRSFPGEIGVDLWSGESRVGDHADADYVAEFDEPSTCNRWAGRVIRWSSPCPFMWFGEDLDVAEHDGVRHQQAERGDEQRGDFGLADVGSGNIDAKPMNGQVTTVAEVDDSVEGGTVFGHEGSIHHEGEPRPARRRPRRAVRGVCRR